MAVEMIIDPWNPSKRRYRTETFCSGSRACSLYRFGPGRKVPGRHGMSYTQEDWVDDRENFTPGSRRVKHQGQKNIQIRQAASGMPVWFSHSGY